MRSFTAIRKEAGISCGSFLQKGEVLAYVGFQKKKQGPKQEVHDAAPLNIYVGKAKIQDQPTKI